MGGLFGSLARGFEAKAADISALTWERLFGEPSSRAGVSVGLDSALRTATVLGCTRVHAEGIAQLPLKVMRGLPEGGNEPARDHPTYSLLHDQPNEWMSSFEFRETLMFHAVLTGDAVAVINRVRGRIVELLPAVPGKWQVERNRLGERQYHFFGDRGDVIGTLPRASVMHLRGPSWDGIAGLDMVQQARESIGLSIATEESHARLHANGARPSGLLSMDGSLSPEAREQIKAAWHETYEGVKNAGKTVVLDMGAKWTPMQMTGVDAQHLEVRKHQIEEICRALRVMPVMLNHPADIAARAAMEQLFIAHVVHYLMPWVRRWEGVIKRDLLHGEPDLHATFTVAGLMRGALKDQGEYFAKALGSGGSPAWLTPNEVRDLLEMNPKPGGDELPRPTNPGMPGGGNGDE